MDPLTAAQCDLAARFWPLALATARRCARDRDDRADAAASGLMRAASECPDPAWMARLVRLRVAEKARLVREGRHRAKRTPPGRPAPVGSDYHDRRSNRRRRCDPPDPGDHARDADDRDEAAALLGRLPPADRALVVALAAGESQRRAAARLGISQALVSRRLARIRSQFRPQQDP